MNGGTPASRQPLVEVVRRAQLDNQDILAMHALAPLSTGYLPWTVSAMRPSGVAAVLNEILVNRRRHIVELGGGISTYFIARLLSGRGGHLWTVEHDEVWAGVLREELAKEGLDELATVVHAPLTGTDDGWPGEQSRWYDRDRLRQATAAGPPDLLIVDGPPAHEEGLEHARYPALPFFAPLLAADHAIILDDIDRFGEQDIMQRWEREFGTAFESRPVHGRIGVWHSRPAYTI
jgi:methyltransferase family protein